MAGEGPSPMRSFDPRRVGELECTTWVAYYRRDWPVFLRAAVGLTRHCFGFSWPEAIRAAWHVLRANQAWAPYPDNDPERARRDMARFYRLVAARHGEPFDVEEAARLEVDWWRIHREHQRGAPGADDRPLVAALVRLYGHVYGVPSAPALETAAAERALGMRWSDDWVAAGRVAGDPLIAAERAALVRSYAALLAAVHRA